MKEGKKRECKSLHEQINEVSGYIRLENKTERT